MRNSEPPNMYNWRKMSSNEQEEILALRKARKLPWHAPPHLKYEGELSFIVSATCFEHKHVIGKDASRLTECEAEILQVCEELDCSIFAW
jgi:putative transposase